MITRTQILLLTAISWVSSAFVTVGILAWDWAAVLVFVVPFLATMPLLVVFDWLNSRGDSRGTDARRHGPRHRPAGAR
jgi:hypothetical protein